jgi:type II secretory pathway pseudopilin PulG
VSTTLAVLVLAAASAAGAIGVAAWVGRRRRRERNARRIAALTAVAERIDAAVASLGEAIPTSSAEQASGSRAATAPRPPVIQDGLVGRTALLGAVADAVERARAEDSRLSGAVVRVTETDAARLAGVVHDVAQAEAYAVGPRSVALVLPGLGRAEALGVLARIEAQCAASGSAVELGPGEDAVEFAARLLAGRIGSASPGSVPDRE